MKISDFTRLQEKKPKKPIIGDIFLEGIRMIGQKGSKKVGQIVTVYEIVRVIGDGSNVEYVPRYFKLEDDG